MELPRQLPGSKDQDVSPVLNELYALTAANDLYYNILYAVICYLDKETTSNYGSIDTQRISSIITVNYICDIFKKEFAPKEYRSKLNV